MAAYFSKIDLHLHTTGSDGALTPTELVKRAIDRGLHCIAITDHDSVLGVDEAVKAAGDDLIVIPGAELSATWRNQQIHIAALFLDTKSEALVKFLEEQNKRRIERAQNISLKLSKQGIFNAYEKCLEIAGKNATVTRGNFADLIVREGRASSNDDAFNYYLKKGKSCYVATNWPSIEEVIEVIHKAHGLAVLAHPKRYDLTNTKLRALMEEFKTATGDGIEVVASQMRPTDKDYLAGLCLKYDFYASLGSDFHRAGPFRELGLNLLLPNDLKKIWEHPAAIRFNNKIGRIYETI